MPIDIACIDTCRHGEYKSVCIAARPVPFKNHLLVFLEVSNFNKKSVNSLIRFMTQQKNYITYGLHGSYLSLTNARLHSSQISEIFQMIIASYLQKCVQCM